MITIMVSVGGDWAAVQICNFTLQHSIYMQIAVLSKFNGELPVTVCVLQVPSVCMYCHRHVS